MEVIAPRCHTLEHVFPIASGTYTACITSIIFDSLAYFSYGTTANATEPEVKGIYEDLRELLELTPKSNLLLIMGNWNENVRKSSDTWSNKQVWIWGTKQSRTKANCYPRRTHWS